MAIWDGAGQIVSVEECRVVTLRKRRLAINGRQNGGSDYCQNWRPRLKRRNHSTLGRHRRSIPEHASR